MISDYYQLFSQLCSTFDIESNYLNSFGPPNVHLSRNHSLLHAPLSVSHESLGFENDQQFNHIQQTEDGTRSLQDSYFREQKGSAKISNTVKNNIDSDNPIFPYVVPTDVLIKKPGYDQLTPSMGITDQESSQPESTLNFGSSNDSTLTPEESSFKPRRYFLTLIYL